MFNFFRKKQPNIEVKSLNSWMHYLSNGDFGKANHLNPALMYNTTSIGFLCVEKIASEAESFSFKVVKNNGEEIQNHPCLNLIFGKNINNGGLSLFSSLIRNLLIHGEAFALRYPFENTPTKNIHMMQSIFPDRVNKVTAGDDMIKSYNITHLGKSIAIPIDLSSGYSDLFRVSVYSSRSYIQGTSPMEASGIEGDLIKEALEWNVGLLKNGSKISGIISGDSAIGLSENQMIEMKENIKNLFSGSQNAGNVAQMAGNFKFEPIGMKPVDMDFQNTLKMAMQNVALSFKVPLPLIFEDASTLDNYKMAREEFIIQTVIPHVKTILESLSMWFNIIYKEDVKIVIDKDSIEGLEEKRSRLSSRMIEYVKNGLITINEARKKLGYDEINEPLADSLLINQSQVPIELLDSEPNESI